MKAYKIHYSQFDENKLIFPNTTTKQTKPAPDPNNPSAAPVSYEYFEIEMKYIYDDVDINGNPTQVVEEFNVEGCECYTNYGITIKEKNGIKNASVLAYFDLTKPETQDFVSFDDIITQTPEGPKSHKSFWSKFYNAVTNYLFSKRGNFTYLAKISTKAGFEGVFPYPIYYQKDKATCEIIRGKNPSKYFDLINFGEEGTPTRKESEFTIPAPPGSVDNLGKPVYKQVVPWKILKQESGNKFSFIPLLKMNKLTITKSGVSLKTYATTGVITDITRSSFGNQDETLQNIQKDASKLNSIQNQVAALLGGLNLSHPAKTTETNQHHETNSTPNTNNIPNTINIPTNSIPSLHNPISAPTPTPLGLPSVKPINNLESKLGLLNTTPVLGKIPGLPTITNVNPINTQ